MREVGLIFRIRVKWLPKKPTCEGDGRDFTTVGLREIYPLIYIYLCGTFISMLIFCLELTNVHCKAIKLKLFKTNITMSTVKTA